MAEKIRVHDQQELNAAIAKDNKDVYTIIIDSPADQTIIIKGHHRNIIFKIVNTSVVKIYDSVTALAFDNTIVYAYNHALVCAWNNTIVYAYDTTRIYAHTKTTIYAYDTAHVTNNDTVTLNMSDKSTSTLLGNKHLPHSNPMTHSTGCYFNPKLIKQSNETIQKISPDKYTWRHGFTAWHATRIDQNGRCIRLTLGEAEEKGDYFLTKLVMVCLALMSGAITMLSLYTTHSIWITLGLVITSLFLMYTVLAKRKLHYDDFYTVKYSTPFQFFSRDETNPKNIAMALNSYRTMINDGDNALYNKNMNIYAEKLINIGISPNDAYTFAKLQMPMEKQNSTGHPKAAQNIETCQHKVTPRNSEQNDTVHVSNTVSKYLISMDDRLQLLFQLEKAVDIMHPLSAYKLQECKTQLYNTASEIIAVKKAGVLNEKQIEKLDTEFALLVNETMPIIEQIQEEIAESSLSNIEVTRKVMAAQQTTRNALDLN